MDSAWRLPPPGPLSLWGPLVVFGWGCSQPSPKGPARPPEVLSQGPPLAGLVQQLSALPIQHGRKGPLSCYPWVDRPLPPPCPSPVDTGAPSWVAGGPTQSSCPASRCGAGTGPPGSGWRVRFGKRVGCSRSRRRFLGSGLPEELHPAAMVPVGAPEDSETPKQGPFVWGPEIRQEALYTGHRVCKALPPADRGTPRRRTVPQLPSGGAAFGRDAFCFGHPAVQGRLRGRGRFRTRLPSLSCPSPCSGWCLAVSAHG